MFIGRAWLIIAILLAPAFSRSEPTSEVENLALLKRVGTHFLGVDPTSRSFRAHEAVVSLNLGGGAPPSFSTHGRIGIRVWCACGGGEHAETGLLTLKRSSIYTGEKIIYGIRGPGYIRSGQWVSIEETDKANSRLPLEWFYEGTLNDGAPIHVALYTARPAEFTAVPTNFLDPKFRIDANVTFYRGRSTPYEGALPYRATNQPMAYHDITRFAVRNAARRAPVWYSEAEYKERNHQDVSGSHVVAHVGNPLQFEWIAAEPNIASAIPTDADILANQVLIAGNLDSATHEACTLNMISRAQSLNLPVSSEIQPWFLNFGGSQVTTTY